MTIKCIKYSLISFLLWFCFLSSTFRVAYDLGLSPAELLLGSVRIPWSKRNKHMSLISRYRTGSTNDKQKPYYLSAQIKIHFWGWTSRIHSTRVVQIWNQRKTFRTYIVSRLQRVRLWRSPGYYGLIILSEKSTTDVHQCSESSVTTSTVYNEQIFTKFRVYNALREKVLFTAKSCLVVNSVPKDSGI